MFFFLQDLPPAVPVECIINKTSYYFLLIPFILSYNINFFLLSINLK